MGAAARFPPIFHESPMADLQPSFRSTVNPWQCDENDHLNAQFYTAFGDDAAAQWLSLFGLGPQARRAAGIAVRPVSDHIRYWQELRGDDSVQIASAPVAVEDRRVVLFSDLRNSFDGGLAATLVRAIECRDASGQAIAFPAAFLARAREALVGLPERGQPRSAGRFGELPDLTLAQAQAAQTIEINRSIAAPEECDAAGYLRPRFHFSRFSDGAGILWHSLGFDRITMRQRRQGTVVLETRTLYRRPIPVGTPTVVLSGLLDASDKILHIAHLIFDVESGTLCAAGEAIGVLFDQQTRRSVAMSQAERTYVAGRVIKELRG
jgi:acyl-CoA thioester hydrolase